MSSWAYTRYVVLAPAEITAGSVLGEPWVDVGPASPDDTSTTVPAATAASSAWRMRSFIVSGNGL